jgi:hypothetical protein
MVRHERPFGKHDVHPHAGMGVEQRTEFLDGHGGLLWAGAFYAATVYNVAGTLEAGHDILPELFPQAVVAGAN